MKKNGQFEIQVGDPQNLLIDLVGETGLSEEDIQDAANKGALWIRPELSSKYRRLRDLASGVAAGNVVAINYDEIVLATVPEEPTLISDQVNFSVWNKPAGMMSQGSKWGDHCSIAEVVRRLHGKKTHLVHRLDRAASGLIIVAHTHNAVRELTTLFATRKIQKHYEAFVHGNFKLQLPHVINTKIDSKSARTTVLVSRFEPQSDTSQLTVSITTGRKHQIRKHLSESGFPIVGDRLYSGRQRYQSDLQLKAVLLAFDCPFTGKSLQFTIGSGRLET